MDGNTLNLLADLLKRDTENEEDDELDNPKPSPYITPGVIGPKVTVGTDSVTKKDNNIEKDIWGIGEVHERGEHEYNDSREEPVYETLYKQSVGSEDIFLGMGNKTPLTSSCNILLVRINLPDTEFKDIDLITTETFVDCRTPKYRLGLHLPHSVDSDSSSAKWHRAKCVLEVSLTLVREYDFVND